MVRLYMTHCKIFVKLKTNHPKKSENTMTSQTKCKNYVLFVNGILTTDWMRQLSIKIQRYRK